MGATAALLVTSVPVFLGAATGSDPAGIPVDVGGEVRRVDAAGLAWDRVAGHDGVTVVAGTRRTFLVDRSGSVRILDLRTMQVLHDVPLAGAAGRPIVTDSDALVVPLEAGRVQVVTGSRAADPVAVGGDAIPQLGLVGTEVVAMTGDDGLVVLDDDGSVVVRHEVGLSADEVELPDSTATDTAWMVAAHTGELVGVHLATGGVEHIGLTRGGQVLSRPALTTTHVYVVDRTDGRVIEVRLGDKRVTRSESLGLADASRVELTSRGDVVFVNDPGSDMALVIERGRFTRFDKKIDDSSGLDATAEPSPSTSVRTPPSTTAAPSPQASETSTPSAGSTAPPSGSTTSTSVDPPTPEPPTTTAPPRPTTTTTAPPPPTTTTSTPSPGSSPLHEPPELPAQAAAGKAGAAPGHQ